MEISGSHFSLTTWAGSDRAEKYPHHSVDQQTQPQTKPTKLKQVIKTDVEDYEKRQRRFYSVDRDLSHSARQALNSYADSDNSGGELMNRVDVYV